MDESLTPVVIDGKLFLFTHSQLMRHEFEQKRQAQPEAEAETPSVRGVARRVVKSNAGSDEHDAA